MARAALAEQRLAGSSQWHAGGQKPHAQGFISFLKVGGPGVFVRNHAEKGGSICEHRHPQEHTPERPLCALFSIFLCFSLCAHLLANGYAAS
jgi:hypothetical protein